MKLRLELYWDDEAEHWGFTVPALHIVGGGDEARSAAIAHAIDAIAFTLEGVESDFDESKDIQVEYLDVEVGPSRAVASGKAG